MVCAGRTNVRGGGGAIVGCLAAVIAVASIASAPLRAQDGPSPERSSQKSDVIARCREATPAHRDAEAALRALDQRIRGLSVSASPAEAMKELQALLRTECFRLAAAENPRLPTPDSSVSLRAWWGEHFSGGSGWLASYLTLPELEGLSSHVVVPPDVRKTLDLTTQPDHPLRSLLCAREDSACGAATKGWKLRANHYFEAFPVLEAEWLHTEADEVPARDGETIARRCEARLAAAPPARRYQEWRVCVEHERPKRVAFPLGEFQAPQAGWIIITGRRGHHEFCFTTRAYDLATGAVFIDDSCSSMVFEWDGNINHDMTKRVMTDKVRRGTVMVESLREAVWMMLLRGETAAVQIESELVPLPDGVIAQVTSPPQWTDGPISAWSNTGQTTLTWRWVRGADPSIAGQLVYPVSENAAEAHAASLLDIAEEGFVEGCPPVRPPADLRSPSTSKLNDVPGEQLATLESDYRDSLEKWKAMPACR
jgi:hypothetical protein